MLLFVKCAYTKCNRIDFFHLLHATLRFVAANLGHILYMGTEFQCADMNKTLELVNLRSTVFECTEFQ